MRRDRRHALFSPACSNSPCCPDDPLIDRLQSVLCRAARTEVREMVIRLSSGPAADNVRLVHRLGEVFPISNVTCCIRAK